MDRELALKLHKIYLLEKEYKRAIYPEEIWAHGICSSSKINDLIESLLKDHSIIGVAIRGANAYNITNTGRAHLESYLDIKREM